MCSNCDENVIQQKRSIPKPDNFIGDATISGSDGSGGRIPTQGLSFHSTPISMGAEQAVCAFDPLHVTGAPQIRRCRISLILCVPKTICKSICVSLDSGCLFSVIHLML